MAKRQTIPEGSDPLSAVLGTSEPFPPRAKPKVPSPRKVAVEKTEESARKFGFRLPDSLCEEIRDCVVALQGPPLHLTVSQFGEEACRRELERLKAEHNDGESFSKRGKNPRVGRPVRG